MIKFLAGVVALLVCGVVFASPVPGPLPEDEMPAVYPIAMVSNELFQISDIDAIMATTIFERVSSPLAWGIYVAGNPDNKLYLSGNFTGTLYEVVVSPLFTGSTFGVFASSGLDTFYSQVSLNVDQQVHILAATVENEFYPSLLFAAQNMYGNDGLIDLRMGCVNCEPVTAVPIPGAGLLFIGALGGLILIARKRIMSKANRSV